ncbi:hypothetical protein H696_01964 [Fonticula alba]|uniref:C2H2-type domain-containing protein n=1 Tax=Fonticula alba TaxID=691883 RepID=A0A058ZAS0_FONAL|nr:hypothetical protein H696_01964 [Fonticula alba]KCV71018.1 hypothetical protein H696_01964 [Fonticula alba]|eukprot:XP_009494141.1 hypothetical protein H696_01964 [Fonticula alba]
MSDPRIHAAATFPFLPSANEAGSPRAGPADVASSEMLGAASALASILSTAPAPQAVSGPFRSPADLPPGQMAGSLSPSLAHGQTKSSPGSAPMTPPSPGTAGLATSTGAATAGSPMGMAAEPAGQHASPGLPPPGIAPLKLPATEPNAPSAGAAAPSILECASCLYDEALIHLGDECPVFTCPLPAAPRCPGSSSVSSSATRFRSISQFVRHVRRAHVAERDLWLSHAVRRMLWRQQVHPSVPPAGAFLPYQRGASGSGLTSPMDSGLSGTAAGASAPGSARARKPKKKQPLSPGHMALANALIEVANRAASEVGASIPPSPSASSASSASSGSSVGMAPEQVAPGRPILAAGVLDTPPSSESPPPAVALSLPGAMPSVVAPTPQPSLPPQPLHDTAAAQAQAQRDLSMQMQLAQLLQLHQLAQQGAPVLGVPQSQATAAAVADAPTRDVPGGLLAPGQLLSAPVASSAEALDIADLMTRHLANIGFHAMAARTPPSGSEAGVPVAGVPLVVAASPTGHRPSGDGHGDGHAPDQQSGLSDDVKPGRGRASLTPVRRAPGTRSNGGAPGSGSRASSAALSDTADSSGSGDSRENSPMSGPGGPGGGSDRPAGQRTKRFRRAPDLIDRLFACSHDGCTKAYGTLSHLNTHVRLQGHGSPRTLRDFDAALQARHQATRTELGASGGGSRASRGGGGPSRTPADGTGSAAGTPGSGSAGSRATPSPRSAPGTRGASRRHHPARDDSPAALAASRRGQLGGGAATNEETSGRRSVRVPARYQHMSQGHLHMADEEDPPTAEEGAGENAAAGGGGGGAAHSAAHPRRHPGHSEDDADHHHRGDDEGDDDGEDDDEEEEEEYQLVHAHDMSGEQLLESSSSMSLDPARMLFQDILGFQVAGEEKVEP